MQGDRKIRLDNLLTMKGLAPTRSRARDLIRRGVVRVAGEVEKRPGIDLVPEIEISITEDWTNYVSRGALKLQAAFTAFGFDIREKIALDIGASTGGFTQLLLMEGAKRVYAVDIGSGQLHSSLKTDGRVTSLENFDARRLDASIVPDPVEAITADISFISLTKALPAGLALVAPGAWLIALVKPQFEAGREAVGKGGIVKKDADRERALHNIVTFVNARPGWAVEGTIASPIIGQSGNAEYLLGARYAP